jgi:hypothetical protein
MIRPLSRPQLAARALQHASVADAPPTDSALVEQVQALERENLRLRQESTNREAALTSSEERASKLDRQCLELTRTRSPREDQQARITELEQQIAALTTDKASLAQQVLALSAEPKPVAAAPGAPTLITVLDIAEDKKSSDGAVSARVKLDDVEADVFLTSSLETARKLLRRVKEA